MNNIYFSIITVVFNAKIDLERTNKSIQAQTYKEFEHIIIDGYSNDGTVDYLKSLQIMNIKYMSEKDNGIYDAMNKGIQLARGEYVLFLNAADLFSSNKVLDLVGKCIEENNFPDIIYGGANVFSHKGKFLSKLKPLKLNKTNLNKFSTRTLCHQSIFVKRDKVPFYSDKYILKSELNWYYDLLKVVKEDNILQIDEPVCNYYLGGTGDKNFWKNFIERIIVTKNQNNFLSFIFTIPFFIIPIVFRARRIIFGK